VRQLDDGEDRLCHASTANRIAAATAFTPWRDRARADGHAAAPISAPSNRPARLMAESAANATGIPISRFWHGRSVAAKHRAGHAGASAPDAPSTNSQHFG